MRHQKRGRKLGRSASHRKAMLSNMAASILIHKQIKTTEAKAKEVRRLVERLITYGKKDTTHARRLAFAVLRDKKATKILFEEVAPVYTNRQGGYTRLIKLGFRPNDTAKVVLLQLVDFFSEESKKDKKKTADKKAAAKPATKKSETKAASEATPEKTEKEPDKEVAVADEEAAETAVETVAEETVNVEAQTEETDPEVTEANEKADEAAEK
ncbi:MAG: 50S ribosomal protein L17 [FCB group bacterium]|nr:50S ribosomal protein L17 [FCB group bacterium]